MFYINHTLLADKRPIFFKFCEQCIENSRTIEIFQRENIYIERAEESHVIFVTYSFENLNAYAFDFLLFILPNSLFKILKTSL